MTIHGEIKKSHKTARSQISVFCLPQSKYKEKKSTYKDFSPTMNCL